MGVDRIVLVELSVPVSLEFLSAYILSLLCY